MMVLVLIPTLQSCDNDDDYSLDNFTIALVTVKKDAGKVPYFVSDKGLKLWAAASLVPYRDLEDGARLMASFTLLSDKQGEFDHYVRLNDYSKVLTKDVINLNLANKDSIGDDKVRITDMWVSGDYLNVEFQMNLPSANKHRVNLVKNTTVTDPADDYIHLEYRYNDMDDVTSYIAHSVVSFKLGENSPLKSTKKGLKIRINSAVNGEKIIQLDYSRPTPQAYVMSKSMNMYNLEKTN